MEAGTLARAAKTIFYTSNGTGRDSYIHSNSGGLCATHNNNNQPPVGTMDHRHAPRNTMRVIHSKPVYYHSNGTGRDSYVCTSSGGLHLPY